MYIIAGFGPVIFGSSSYYAFLVIFPCSDATCYAYIGNMDIWRSICYLPTYIPSNQQKKIHHPKNYINGCST